MQYENVNHAEPDEVVKGTQRGEDRCDQSRPQFRKRTKKLNKLFEVLRKQLQLPSSYSRSGILEKAYALIEEQRQLKRTLQQRAQSLRGEHRRLLREHQQLSQENQRLLSNIQWHKERPDLSKSHEVALQNQPTNYAWPTYYGDYNA